ncbi:MAG: hypothetical protein Q8Q12_20385 [bacterium]|nr:hypothetical protein [bacterium]
MTEKARSIPSAWARPVAQASRLQIPTAPRPKAWAFLFVMCVLSPASAPIAHRMEREFIPVPEGAGQVSGSFEKLPLEDERDRDEIVLKNGDSLSGEVTGIRGGTVYFHADMAEGEIKATFASLKIASFRKKTQREGPTVENADTRRGTGFPPVSGEVALVEGGRFGATIHRMEGLPEGDGPKDRLFFSPAPSPDSTEMSLGLDKIASVAFSREPLVLLKADFSAANSSPFTANEGEWVVYDGRFLQSDPSQHNATAYVRVKQQGLMQYSWTLHKTDWGHAGVYILASEQKPGNGSQGYRIHLEHGRLVLYKVEEGGESQGFWCPVAPGMTTARIEVLYNCPARRIQIWLDGRQVAHLSDIGSPVQAGDYVVLLTVGRAAFDDVRVEQLGGDATVAEEEAGKDVVVLSNGDRIAGEVVEISKDKVVVARALPARSGPENLAMDRGKMLRVVFGGRTCIPVKRSSIVFWDETRLEGDVGSLENDIVEVQNPVLGRVRFRAAAVKCILF